MRGRRRVRPNLIINRLQRFSIFLGKSNPETAGVTIASSIFRTFLKLYFGPMRRTKVDVYRRQNRPSGLRHPRMRALLVFAVLACFFLVQNPAAEVLHNHSHSGAHTHCCAACHGGHLAVPRTSLHFHAPFTSTWNVVAGELRAAVRLSTSASSSRAPPA